MGNWTDRETKGRFDLEVSFQSCFVPYLETEEKTG